MNYKMAEKKKPNSRVSNLQLLQLNSESLESLLEEEDLVRLCSKLVSHNVITGSTRDNFTCLDPDKERLPPDTRVRYLLQQVWERAREDGQVYGSFVSVLRRLGGDVRGFCDTMGEEKSGMEEGISSWAAAVGGRCLNEKDIPNLLEVVTEYYLWEEIGWALGLPKRVIEECRKSSSDVLRLCSVLSEWIKSAGFDGVRPATVDSLRAVLSSKTVGLLCCANKLRGCEASGDTHGIQEPLLLHLLFRSDNTVVLEGKSTLLEVQVAGSGEESYQWSKEGRPLVEGRDFCGVSSSMLYINRASQHVEGRYSCSISNGRDAVCSDEIDVQVIYSPEKEHLLQYYHGIKNNRVCNPTFVNLVLINQRGRSRYDYTIRGDVDDILGNKKIAEYDEIFREHKEGEVVLIEGRPGSGKTTLVHKITQDWAKGKAILQGARHVFLVTLRHLNYSKRDESVSDIIDVFYDSEEIRKVVENEIKKSRGRGVCFILDGLDEYQNSNVESIINQLKNKIVLPSSMVIVASRPAATQSLRDKCARRVEVVGFTKDQISTYVETYPFESRDGDISDKVSKMKIFLDVRPNVHHMCYLPVQANIVCFLFDNKGVNIPHTESRIYEEFTVSTINRHKQRNNEQFQIQSPEELEGEDKLQFSSICKLAFEMTKNSQQVVSKKEAQKFLHTTEGSFFSLLTVERISERLYIVEEVYTFHHLTFQEYLAARHLASLSAEDQLLVISGISCIVDNILRNVKKFYCGIVKYADLIVNMRNKYFLSNLLHNSEYWQGIQCAFESQQIELCDYVVENSTVSLYYGTTIRPSDWSALGYVMSTVSTVVTKLVFDRVNISKDGVSAFLSSVSKSALIRIKELKWKNGFKDSFENYEAMNILLSKLPSLQKLEILMISFSKSVFVCLTRNVELAKLEVLNIYFALIPCSYPEEVFKLLKFGSSKKVKVYYSCSNDENSAISRKLLNYVFGSSAPQASDISWLYLCNSSEISSVPPERFSHCTDIVLVNCGIDDNRAEILASDIRASVLEKLVLDFNRISDSGAKALAEQLASSCGLKVFSVQCNSIRDLGAAALASSIAGIESLRKLDLQGNDIRDEGVVAIAKAAKQIPGLDLYLFNVEVTQEGIRRVLELRATTNIKTMVLGSSWDSICDEGIEALSSISMTTTLPALRINETAAKSQATNMENIRRVLTEEPAGMNIRSLEVMDDADEDSAPALCDILGRTKFLNHLSIKDVVCKDSVTLKKLYDSLKLLEHLFSVSMSGSKCLFPCLKMWVNIHDLNMCSLQLSTEDIDLLHEVLVQLKSLQCLRLSNVSIDDDGAVALAEALKDHTSLTLLDISHNNITLVGMSAFAPVIRTNNIHHLDIAWNDIKGVYRDLALAIVDCGDSLQSLNTSNAIDNANELVCISNPSLYGFTDYGWIKNILKGLFTMNGLVDLNISRCHIDMLLEPLAKGLMCCNQLLKLNISCNAIGSEGIVSLSKKLQFCHNLLELDLSGNNITPDAVPAIALVMENCCHLKELDLSWNTIGIDGAAFLVAAWTHKTVLTLDLSGCVESSCESSLLEGEEHCSGCSRLLQLYQFNDNIIIKMKVIGECVPKLISSARNDIKASS